LGVIGYLKQISKEEAVSPVRAKAGKKKNKMRRDDERGPLDESKHYVMTLRLPLDLNEALERYIDRHSEKQRQKKRVIVHALRKFLVDAGEI
jgi:hypothetical protein